MIEGNLEDRAIKRTVNQHVRGVVVGVSLFEGTASNYIRRNLFDHRSKDREEILKLCTTLSVRAHVKEEVRIWDAQQSRDFAALGLSNRSRVGPRNVNFIAVRHQALNPGADGNLIIRMSHAEEPSAL